jgi:hypothetical protein
MQTVLAVGFLAALMIFCGILISALFGAFAGWLVGALFDETMAELIRASGLNVVPWQLGLMLGFVGGFFKSSLSTDSKK